MLHRQLELSPWHSENIDAQRGESDLFSCCLVSEKMVYEVQIYNAIGNKPWFLSFGSYWSSFENLAKAKNSSKKCTLSYKHKYFQQFQEVHRLPKIDNQVIHGIQGKSV